MSYTVATSATRCCIIINIVFQGRDLDFVPGKMNNKLKNDDTTALRLNVVVICK